MEPKEVFAIFAEINKVPRPSKHEEKISQWLVDFAQKNGIEYQVDGAMNVVMRVPATAGYEGHPGVIMQAHQDMVCEKNNDTEHDFMHDPIQTYVDGEWLKAKGTTLGADNGIGMAMALAALTDKHLQHPALEALFTVDEETGLTGANRLEDGMLRGQRLINLDNEDDGVICIGCAGGIDTLAKMHYTPEALDGEGWFAARIQVGGLMGGHSGEDINKGRANANKLLVNFLHRLFTQTEVRLSHIDGGNLRNAIAREAEATVCVPMAYKESLRVSFNEYAAVAEELYGDVEKEMELSMESTELPTSIIPTQKAYALISALVTCPHGMVAMCKDIPNLVETSTNLASIKMRDGYIEVNTSQRSSVESEKHRIKRIVEYALALACDEVTHGDGYPGWAPNVNSDVLEVAKKAWKELYKSDADVVAIHAGLECGLFLEKYPHLDMISFGPQMYGVHSPQERLSIPSTERCYRWLKKCLENL